MPCKCSGVRYEKCACRVFGRHQSDKSEDTVLLVAQESDRRLIPWRAKRNFWLRIYENLYEQCAGYNLRYCPFRGVCTKNFVNEALRDLVVLLCFLFANSVVFLTIFARMTVHVSFALIASASWTRRSLLKKIISKKEAIVSSQLALSQLAKSSFYSKSQYSHDFSPPHKIF